MSKIKLKRHTFVRNGVGIVPLTKGMEAVIDIDMVDHIGSYNWYEQHGYASRTSFGKRVAMHQQVMEYAGTYVPKGMPIDHVNRRPLDNRLANLRVVTTSQNAINVASSLGGSQYRGVRWNSNAKKWESVIGINGVIRYLGLFDDEIEAAKIYVAAARDAGIYEYLTVEDRQKFERDEL